MHKLVVPALILATVALSSSNFLPVESISELNENQLDDKYQQNDNTFSNKEQTRKLNAILFNLNIEPEIDKIPSYIDSNEDYMKAAKEGSYNVKGFRKEQWHNYPRQMDRLNRYFYLHQNADKRNIDPDDPENYPDKADKTYEDIDDRYKELTNEYVPENDEYLNSNDNLRNDANIRNDEAEMAAAVMNPLLILRIHLDCYNNKQKQANELSNVNLQDIEEDRFLKEFNTGSNQIKVKREDKNPEDVDSHDSTNPTVNKRIFALFSRLQSLNPKGHKLHHRRHLYAMYGPDSDAGGGGGGVLTAETRATFMRPPGSPLRWG